MPFTVQSQASRPADGAFGVRPRRSTRRVAVRPSSDVARHERSRRLNAVIEALARSRARHYRAR